MLTDWFRNVMESERFRASILRHGRVRRPRASTRTTTMTTSAAFAVAASMLAVQLGAAAQQAGEETEVDKLQPNECHDAADGSGDDKAKTGSAFPITSLLHHHHHQQQQQAQQLQPYQNSLMRHIWTRNTENLWIRHVPSSFLSPSAFSDKSSCEESAAAAFRFSRLRRHQTIQKIQQTSTKATLSSKYHVIWRKPLGQGTFGAVYIATHQNTGEAVAVKKIAKRFTDNITFQREMEALMYLREMGGHPHICGLRENFDEGNYYYLVLDLVSGGEMFEHLCAQGPYSEADAARLLREVASALAFLHGIGIVHGDLKPENLMLSSEHSSDAVIKVVDFGSAQIVNPECTKELRSSLSTSSVAAFGLAPKVPAGALAARGTANTPAYSPPEILDKTRDSPMDTSFDMWAIGVILYIMLTGVHPFDLNGNATDTEIEQAIVAGQRPPLRDSQITAHLSKDAIELIERLLEWDPEKRLTAHELLENPWVRGETASQIKMAGSDKRLSSFRAFKTKIGARVFADFVAFSDKNDADEVAKRTSLIERAFQELDPEHRGYVTTNDLRRLTKHQQQQQQQQGKPKPAAPVVGGDSGDSEQQQLSLSGFSDLLSENMVNRYFPKGHIVYHEGDIGNNMYFINSGSVEVYTRDGFSKVLRKQGDFFGEGALLSPNKVRSASIRCVTPVHAIEISRDYFEKYLASDDTVIVSLREKDKVRKSQRAKTMLRLQQSMTNVAFSKGEFLFKYGDPGKELFIVDEGEVDVTVDHHTAFTLKPGDMCGLHSLLMKRPRDGSAICVSDKCKLHVLYEKQFNALLDANPSMKESLREMCLRREFQKALCVYTKKAFPKNDQDLREAFEAMDTNKDGAVDLKNIRTILKKFDPSYSEKDVVDILKSLDLDESGEVKWIEFKKIFGISDQPRPDHYDT